MQKCKEQTEKREEAARSRWHEVIVYPEDGDAGAVLARAAEAWPEWVGILHDLDVNQETGELKKAHYHLLLHSGNARSVSAVAKLLRIPANLVEAKANGEAAMAYLLHATDKATMEGKHPYPVEALEGPLSSAAAEAARKARGGASEGAQVVTILNFIEETPRTERISMAALARWAATSGNWASFRRAAVIFKTVVEEHNAAADAMREKRSEQPDIKHDPLRFARLRAGVEQVPPATVDMTLLEGVKR